MGAADVVPGVSGGTIAFISGIYEELINSIKSVNIQTIKLLLRGKLQDFWEGVNGNFLLALVSGIAISFVSLAKLLKFILANHPVLLWSFFFGLVVASAITVAAKITRWNWKNILGLLVGIVVAYYVTIATPAQTPTAYWFLFLCGALAICAMILPGISGAFILLLLGKYEFIINALSDFQAGVLLIVIAGAAIGLMAFSHLLSWLLKNYHNLAIAILSGFMVGSLNKIWPWKKVVETFVDRHGAIKPLTEDNVLPATYEQLTGVDAQLLPAILFAVAGFILIYYLEKASNKGQTV